MVNALKTILNTSEYIAQKLIQKSIEGSQFYLLSQTPMNKVIDAKLLELDRRQRQHYNDTTFDFVISGSNGLAALVIEFDGPEHFTNEKQIKADIRKSQICSLASLPLLRIDDSYMSSIDKISILEYVLLRFNRWNIEKAELQESFDNYLNSLAEEEYATAIEEMKYLDYTPELNFNYRYQLTEISRIDAEIEEKLGVLNEVFVEKRKYVRSSYQYLSGYPVYGHDGTISFIVKYKLLAIAQRESEMQVFDEEVSEEAKMRWYIYDEKRKTDSLFVRHSYHFDIPGTSIPDLCENIANYKCLKRIRDKCKHFVERGWAFV